MEKGNIDDGLYLIFAFGGSLLGAGVVTLAVWGLGKLLKQSFANYPYYSISVTDELKKLNFSFANEEYADEFSRLNSFQRY